MSSKLLAIPQKTCSMKRKIETKMNPENFDNTLRKRLNSTAIEYKRFYDLTLTTDKTLKDLGRQIKCFNGRLTEIVLDFSGCYRITDDGLKYLCEGMKAKDTLKKLVLNLKECHAIGDEGVQQVGKLLKRLKNLETLEIDLSETLEFIYGDMQVKNMTSKTMVHLLKGLKCANKLKNISISIAGQRWVNDPDVVLISQEIKRLSKLERFEIDVGDHVQEEGCNVGNLGMCLMNCKLTKSHAKLLKDISLNFVDCIGITDCGIRSVCEHLKSFSNLERLNLSFGKGNQILTDRSLDSIASVFESLRELKEVDICMKNCPLLTEEGVLDFIDGIGNLVELKSLKLNFQGCDEITNEVVEYLGIKLSEIQSLEKLSLKLKGCEEITTDGLSLMVKNLAKIPVFEQLYLNLRRAMNVSDQGLKSFGKNLEKISSLKSLKICFLACRQVTNSGLKKLVSSLKNIRSLKNLNLNLNGVDEDFEMKTLMSQIRDMKVLESLALDFSLRKTMNDNEISTLSHGLKSLDSLRDLDLRFHDCEKLTDKSLEYLDAYLVNATSLRNLYLDFTACDSITDNQQKILRKTVRSLPYLKTPILEYNYDEFA